MPPVRVPISDEVLQWAIARTGLSVDELAEKKFKRIRAWLEHTDQPTLNQATELAKLAKIPFGFLLLPTPIEITPNLPDFRTEKNSQLRNISKELEEQIFLCQRSLDWYAENAAELGLHAYGHLGDYDLRDSPELVAKATRREIDWNPLETSPSTPKANALAERLERAGLLVMKSSVVGNKNNLKLDRNEFRGFTLISGSHALIFINRADAPAANLFSLAHEYGHVLLDKQGVSDDTEHNAIERWCNKFAAAFLLPEEYLSDAVGEYPITLPYLRDKSKRLGPSVEAIAWRLVDLGHLPVDQARSLVNEWNRNAPPAANTKDSDGGPSPAVMARARLGSNFLTAVSEAYINGSITYRDASRLTGYKKLDTLEKVLGVEKVASL